MARVLVVGLLPETVDFSDPALPPGMSAERIYAGLALANEQMRARGWTVDECMVLPDDTAGPTLEAQLRAADYDCVVIGAGVRLPPSRLHLFETLVNTIHRASPRSGIAFNTRPDDSGEAAARWLPAD